MIFHFYPNEATYRGNPTRQPNEATQRGNPTRQPSKMEANVKFIIKFC